MFRAVHPTIGAAAMSPTVIAILNWRFFSSARNGRAPKSRAAGLMRTARANSPPRRAAVASRGCRRRRTPTSTAPVIAAAKQASAIGVIPTQTRVGSTARKMATTSCRRALNPRSAAIRAPRGAMRDAATMLMSTITTGDVVPVSQ